MVHCPIMEDLLPLLPSLLPDSETTLIVLAGARLALLVFDRLDERFPRLKKVTKVLGTILGGKQAR